MCQCLRAAQPCWDIAGKTWPWPRETGCLMLSVRAPCGCVHAWLALLMLFDFSRGSGAVKVPLRWSRYLLPTPWCRCLVKIRVWANSEELWSDGWSLSSGGTLQWLRCDLALRHRGGLEGSSGDKDRFLLGGGRVSWAESPVPGQLLQNGAAVSQDSE